MITTEAAIIRRLNQHIDLQNLTTIHTTEGSMAHVPHQFDSLIDGTLKFITQNDQNYFGMTLTLSALDTNSQRRDIEVVCTAYDPDTILEFRDAATGKQSITARPSQLNDHGFVLRSADRWTLIPPDGPQTGWFITEDPNTHNPLRYYAHILNLYNIIGNLHP